MAFLFEADRGLTSVKDPFPHLGPGTYYSDDKGSANPSCAPFLSTGQKCGPLVQKTKALQPGPGICILCIHYYKDHMKSQNQWGILAFKLT